MKRLPAFASINTLERDTIPLSRLRNAILQSSTTFRFSGWTKTNLLNAITFRKCARFSCSVFESAGIDANQGLEIYLSAGERVAFSTLVDQFKAAQYPLNILFLYTDPAGIAWLAEFLATANLNTFFIVASTHDPLWFLFALCCELTHWWSLASTLGDVSYLHIADCLERIIANYRDCVNDRFSYSVVHRCDAVKDIAWRGGLNYAQSVDIEKIASDARTEQIDDTIKRIFDAAAYVRPEHLSTSERMISSQGLFWLAEVCHLNDISLWMQGTRLYEDVVGPVNIGTKVRAHHIIVARANEHFVEFMTGLVPVEGGVYHFGSDNTMIESEPPARPMRGYLRPFRIMKDPVTNGLWERFIQESIANPMSQAPKTGVSFFDAEAFASVIDLVISKELGSQSGLRVQVPTEFQWEAAARGLNGLNYPWGNSFETGRTNCEMVLGRPSPIGSFSPLGDSSFGCRDMSGNVREWTRSYAGTPGLDWTELTSDRKDGDDQAIGPLSRMVIRGGSYSYSAECIQGWVRNTQIASRKDNQTGFRLVVESRP